MTIEFYTKTQIISMFAKDYIELDEHLEHQASEMGISYQALAKKNAETEFEIRLNEGTIEKVGMKYRLV